MITHGVGRNLFLNRDDKGVLETKRISSGGGGVDVGSGRVVVAAPVLQVHDELIFEVSAVGGEGNGPRRRRRRRRRRKGRGV